MPTAASAQSLEESGATSSAAATESPEYRTAIRAGVLEFEAKNFEEAREQFRVAHALSPNARTMRGLGVIEFELRNYLESARYLDQALASTKRPLTPDLHRQTAELLGRARGYLGEVVLQLEPDDVRVTVDGEPVEQAGRMTLQVGDHVLEFAATGRMSQRRKVSVVGRQTQTIAVKLPTLADSSVAGSSAPLPAERSPQRTPVYKTWWLWTAVGVVVASGAVAAVILTRRDPETRYRPVGSTEVPPFVPND